MIITGISAQNVLKYASLELSNLPEKGLIAIDGANESGKSTIGETICFALFGRSFSLDQDELEKLIRWGESRCSVTLRFRVDDDQEYEIARFLDRDSNHGVRLNRVGEEERPIARGAEAVENTLYELLGYGYDEFIESFYLAQREITTPHPHSYAVKTMAGISSLEYVDYEYEEEIEGLKETIESLRAEAAGVQDELDDLDIDQEVLPNLEVQKGRLGEAETQLVEDIEALEQASQTYQDDLPRYRTTRSARGRNRFFRFIFFLLTVVFAGVWGLLKRMPDHPYAAKLQALLGQYIPQWGEQYIPWLLYAAVAAALLFLFTWIRVASLGSRMQRLMASGRLLAEKLDALHQEVPERVAFNASDDLIAEPPATSGPEAASAEPNEAAVTADNTAESEEAITNEEVVNILSQGTRPDEQQVAVICQRIERAEAEPADVRDAVGRELAWLRREQQQLQQGIVHLGQQIWREEDRLNREQHFQQTLQGLNGRISETERSVHLRELAKELLSGATRDLSQRFNRDLRDLVGRTLPMFTDGRYEHLQIDEDLTVRVFSSEKRDFMDLEEISSGTQRQIMLALRLALSQELVNSAVQAKQFIFLDEPFAFFDRERTEQSLKVLPELSKEITQIWIIAQEFPENARFSQHLHCQREMTDLKLSAEPGEETISAPLMSDSQESEADATAVDEGADA